MLAKLDKTQARALESLRGLPADAHSLVMCSRLTASGCTLEGPKGAFDELIAFIGEQLADGMLPAPSVVALRSLCVQIDPDCADFLGM